MNKHRLLIIDDEIAFVQALLDFFELNGFEVFTAIRGDIGLEIAVEKEPDVVLLDLKMPRMEGDEVISRMKELCPNTKIIIVTAYNDAKTKDRLVNMGIDGYFDKPISSLVDLEKYIYKLLSKT